MGKKAVSSRDTEVRQTKLGEHFPPKMFPFNMNPMMMPQGMQMPAMGSMQQPNPMMQNWMMQMMQQQGMQMPQVNDGQQMQMPSVAGGGGEQQTTSRSPPTRQRSDAVAKRSQHDWGFADDTKKLSTTFKAIGMMWHYGHLKSTGKKFRASLCCVCDRRAYPMLKVTQLDDEFVDLLLFVLAGVLPDQRPCNMGVATKGEARTQVREMYDVKLEKNASRLSMLSEEFDNLPLVALRLGYPLKCCSLELRRALNAMKVCGDSPMVPPALMNSETASSCSAPSGIDLCDIAPV